MEKKDIRALTKDQLRTVFAERGESLFRGNQVYEWLWKKRVISFDEMTNIPLSTRQWLADTFEIHKIRVDEMQRSSDGTIKNAVRLRDQLVVESVLIPTEKRTTACVSSQVGCSLDCTFCATAQLKRMRNLTPDEIFDQVAVIDNQSRLYYDRPLSNIVFMGMGEPLMNYNNVWKAIEMITSPEGLGMSPKRITLSTSGVPKMIRKLADDGANFNLAVSLHSAEEDLRQQIMPFSKAFPLLELRTALEYWYKKTRRKVTYEYVVWKGLNDTPQAIKALVTFCKYVPCKVNLIEYNAIGDSTFAQADFAAVEAYQKALQQIGVVAKIRRSRGSDIDAACGQLANKNEAAQSV
jgi:23S rRNA (adenine2503-C2)-methyltransferase